MVARIAHSTRTRDEKYGTWSGVRLRMTYGNLPPRSAFMKAFKQEVTDGSFDVRNHPYLGTESYDDEELWDLLSNLAEGDEEQLMTAAEILGSLGFEWV